jgi:ABC-type dipeptide/oligopeptide/nickel transport system ATPase component
MLNMVGIKDAPRRIGDYPHQLSGGMCQRVMIAMAMACRPTLLIADEPTTALDVTTQAQILCLMNDLKEEIGTSIILVTHDLGVVAQACNQVAVMYTGHIVEYACAADIFSDPLQSLHQGTYEVSTQTQLRLQGGRLYAIPGVYQPSRTCLRGALSPQMPRGDGYLQD